MQELAATAARLVVDEGMDYAAAKRRAVKELGLPRRTRLPGNDQVEDEVRAHIRLFHGDTQPQELAALRQLALDWMERLAEFRPHVSGAVWNGTATRLSDIALQLFCDDPKSAEITLIERGIRYDAHSSPGPQGRMLDILSFLVPCPPLGESIGIHLTIADHDDLRGALRPGPDGQPLRGDRQALARRMQQEATP